MKTDSYKINATAFAPILYLSNVADAIEFYKKAFDARELRRWSNPDSSVHIAEMIIEAALFHLHEEVSGDYEFSPEDTWGYYGCNRTICCQPG
jgi:PhnB protein